MMKQLTARTMYDNVGNENPEPPMQRTRFAIFALFWIAWVMVVPFVHHHLIRAPREVTSIHCGGQSCATQCVACQWESTSVAEVHTPPLSPPPLEALEQSLFELPLVCHLRLSTASPRAPPVASA